MHATMPGSIASFSSSSRAANWCGVLSPGRVPKLRQATGCMRVNLYLGSFCECQTLLMLVRIDALSALRSSVSRSSASKPRTVGSARLAFKSLASARLVAITITLPLRSATRASDATCFPLCSSRISSSEERPSSANAARACSVSSLAVSNSATGWVRPRKTSVSILPENTVAGHGVNLGQG
jgi:hypothetical protein